MDNHSSDTMGRGLALPVTLHDYFEERAEYWYDVYRGNTFISQHLNERKERVLALVDRVSQGKSLNILDLGCGAGVLTQALLERGHHVTALDGSESMLKRITGSLAGRTQLDVVHGAVTDTPFSDAYFDTIVCVGVIQYQVNEENFVREIGRVLKSGGSCIFTLPNLLSLNHLTDPLYLGRLLRRLWNRCLLGKEKRASESGLYSLVGQPAASQVYNKKFLKGEIVGKFARAGMTVRQVDGFGYGPLTFRQRSIFSDHRTIWMSDRLTRLSRRSPFRWLSYLANRWVFLAEKV